MRLQLDELRWEMEMWLLEVRSAACEADSSTWGC